MTQIVTHAILVSKDDTRSIWLLQDFEFNTLNYGIITKYRTGPHTSHMAGYVNVNRDQWSQIDEYIHARWPITFEGIESSLFEIPKTFSHNVPVDVLNYWIGIDYMGQTNQPVEMKVALALVRIAHDYNVASKHSSL